MIRSTVVHCNRNDFLGVSNSSPFLKTLKNTAGRARKTLEPIDRAKWAVTIVPWRVWRLSKSMSLSTKSFWTQGQCQPCWTSLQSDCWTSMRSTWPPPSAGSPSSKEGMGHVWIQGISACVRFWSTNFLGSHCHIQTQKRDI